MGNSFEEQKARLEYSLTNIKPTDGAIVDIETLREEAKSFGYHILEFVPDSREKSLAITKLEEAVMWAVKGIVLNQK